MTLDMFEATSLDNASFNLKGRMSDLRNGFKNSLDSNFDAYMDMPDSVDNNISHWVDVDFSLIDGAELGALRTTCMDSVKQMYNGIDLGDGRTGLGIKDISQWNIHPDYQYQNLKQHAGYAAEVIGTTKENMIAFMEANSKYKIKDTLQDTKARVLIVVGDKERPIMKKSASLIKEKIGASRIKIIPNYSHGELSINNPDRYVSIINELITNR